MRKLKRLITLATLGLMSLCSCSGGSGIPGTYSFMMGKPSTTHFGFKLILSEKKPEREDADYELDFDVGGDIGEFGELLQYILHPKQDQPGVYYFDGAYTVGNNTSEGTELNMSINVTTEVVLPSEALKMVVDCFVLGNTANIVIPVSMVDVQCKMYWEGIDTFDGLLNIKTVEAHTGHPTAEQVKEIQDKGRKEFRDWHTVTIGLVKDD